MQKLLAYINNMDVRAQRAVLVSLGLFAAVAAIFVAGRYGLSLDSERALQDWFDGVAQSRWGLLWTILAFTGLAFAGVPQFVLIAVTVVAFGPLTGFFYAWIATMVSASVDFWLGKLVGGRVVRRYAGSAVNRISRFVGRNGFWTALTVRVVPSAPFIVVNMALGVTHSHFWRFAAGTGIGIIPKTALVAFAGRGLMELLSQADWRAGLMVVLAAALWIALMLWGRNFLKRREARHAKTHDPSA